MEFMELLRANPNQLSSTVAAMAMGFALHPVMVDQPWIFSRYSLEKFHIGFLSLGGR